MIICISILCAMLLIGLVGIHAYGAIQDNKMFEELEDGPWGN